MKLAKDKLLIYGLTEAGDRGGQGRGRSREGQDDPAVSLDGVVVKRDVVQGNYYDRKDTLLTIAPAGSPLGTRGRRRARRRQGPDRPDGEGHLPIRDLRAGDREQDRLHRQGDRPRDRTRPGSARRSPTPGADTRPVCSCGWHSRPTAGRMRSRRRPAPRGRQPARPRPSGWMRWNASSTDSSATTRTDRPIRRSSSGWTPWTQGGSAPRRPNEEVAVIRYGESASSSDARGPRARGRPPAPAGPAYSGAIPVGAAS